MTATLVCGGTQSWGNESTESAPSPAQFASASLLGSPQVRAELGMSHTDALHARALLNRAEAPNRGDLTTSEQGRRQRAGAPTTDPEALRRQALGILNSAQKIRLGQIALQWAGPYVLSNSIIRRYLNLSVSQARTIGTHFESAFRRYVQDVQGLRRTDHWYGHLDRQRYAARYAAYDRQVRSIGDRRIHSDRAILASTLTPVQKARWRSLLGRPFSTSHLTYDTRPVPVD